MEHRRRARRRRHRSSTRSAPCSRARTSISISIGVVGGGRGRRVGSRREERDAWSCILGLHPEHLAFEMSLESEEMRSIVAGALEVEADREHRAARALRPLRREPEKHRRIEASSRQHGSATYAREGNVDGVFERATEKGRSLRHARARLTQLTRRGCRELEIDAAIERLSDPVGRPVRDPMREARGIERRLPVDESRQRARRLMTSMKDDRRRTAHALHRPLAASDPVP